MRLISANRSPESQVAGGLALNLAGPRLSLDIDMFQDPEVDLAGIAAQDAATLQAAGLEIDWKVQLPTFHSAEVRDGRDQTGVDWAQDSAWRFYPAERHSLLGWVLHPIDLATNKALAAAGRREPRDIADLLQIDQALFPLSIVMWAAVAKDPGFSPESLIMMIRRFARYQDEDYLNVGLPDPPSAGEMSRRLRVALDRAEAFAAEMPSSHAGLIFIREGRIVEPDPTRLDDYQQRPASRRGVWPIVAGVDVGSA